MVEHIAGVQATARHGHRELYGGEAEGLRRALGSRPSTDKMRALEAKLRAGMDVNQVAAQAQEEIILTISSFALYGFRSRTPRASR